MVGLIKKQYLFYTLLFLIGILSRLPFLEKAQSHWDGPDYTIGILHYSFIEKTPSPPGYPLYIAFGKFFNLFISDPHLSIVLVSVLFAGIGAIVFYLAGKLMFDRVVGIISSSIFLSAPTIFYFGITANPYGILPVTATLVALTVFLIIKEKKDYGFLLALVFSFAIGIRPQDAMFLTPLYLLGWYYLKSQERITSIVGLAFLTLSWFIPTIVAVGGLHEYLSYIYSFTRNDAAPDLSIQRIVQITPIIIKGIYLTCGLASLFLLMTIKYRSFVIYPGKLLGKNIKPYFLVFMFWITPSLLFNIFVRSDHAAHQMTYLSAFIVLVSYFLKNSFRKKIIFVVLILVIINLITFFRDRDPQKIEPYVSQSFHYSEIVKNNERMDVLKNYITAKYLPTQTIVITDPEVFRATSYHLKNYKVYSFGALDTNNFPHANIVHTSFNWHYLKTTEAVHEFTVPSGIRYILFYNNNKPMVFKKLDVVAPLLLVGNQQVYVLKVKEKETLRFSIGQISTSD